MSEQITARWERMAKTHEISRQLTAYIVFGFSMGFLFGVLVHSVFVGLLFGVAVGSLPIIRPDFHHSTAIHRESACTDKAGASELDIRRSAIILPARYGADAAFGSRKRAVVRLDQADVQAVSAWVRSGHRGPGAARTNRKRHGSLKAPDSGSHGATPS